MPGRFMAEQDDVIKRYLSKIASRGGKARANKYDKETLSEWGRLGGRPPKKGAKGGVKGKKSKGRV
jgi:general stress protein YciG